MLADCHHGPCSAVCWRTGELSPTIARSERLSASGSPKWVTLAPSLLGRMPETSVRRASLPAQLAAHRWGMRVLIAEDSAMTRRMLREAVQSLGHECLEAADGL